MAEAEYKRALGVFAGPAYEELEFWYPVLRFRALEASVSVLGIDGESTYFGRAHYPVIPDTKLEDCDQVAAIVIPGIHGYVWGKLADATREFLRSAREQGTVIAAVSSGVAVLADAGLVDGVSISCATDALAGHVEAAGGEASSDRVTVSSGIISARSVEDITAVVHHLVSEQFVTA